MQKGGEANINIPTQFVSSEHKIFKKLKMCTGVTDMSVLTFLNFEM